MLRKSNVNDYVHHTRSQAPIEVSVETFNNLRCNMSLMILYRHSIALAKDSTILLSMIILCALTGTLTGKNH